MPAERSSQSATWAPVTGATYYSYTLVNADNIPVVPWIDGDASTETVIETAPLQLGCCRLEFAHVPRFDSGFDEAVLQIAADVVFAHALSDDVVAAPPQVPEQIANGRPMPFLHFRQPADAVDKLAAVAAGGAETDDARLEHQHVDARSHPPIVQYGRFARALAQTRSTRHFLPR